MGLSERAAVRGAGTRKIDYGAESVLDLQCDPDAHPDAAGEAPYRHYWLQCLQIALELCVHALERKAPVGKRRVSWTQRDQQVGLWLQVGDEILWVLERQRRSAGRIDPKLATELPSPNTPTASTTASPHATGAFPPTVSRVAIVLCQHQAGDGPSARSDMHNHWSMDMEWTECYSRPGGTTQMSDELREKAKSSMRAAEALAEDARHSAAAAVEWVQALSQAALDTLEWAQSAQSVEALEAAAAMELAVEEAMQAVQHLLNTQTGASGSTPSPGEESS